MSAKLPYRPAAIDRSPLTSNAPVEGAERVISCVRRVAADAEQIRNDAAEIEDARVLAEKIVDTCRIILAIESERIANAHPTISMQVKRPIPAVPASAGGPDKSRKAAARVKLGRLSARELEIFTHLAEGWSAAEIALKLSRSSKTINNHRTRILHKLGLKNATELVRLALQSDLVSI